MKTNEKRYTKTAIILHWVMAVIILFTLSSGFFIYLEWIKNDAFLFDVYQWHKSLGVTVLALLLFRLIWRLLNKPPIIKEFSAKENSRARLGHIALYCAMLVMPISGWLAVSSSETGIPTIVFGLFKLAHIPVGANTFINTISENTHFYVGLALLLLIIGHIGLALIHQRKGLKLLQRIKPQSFLTYLAISIMSIALLASLFNNTNSQPSSSQLSHSQPAKSNQKSSQSTSGTESKLVFSGVHADKPFQGSFTDWKLVTDYKESNNSLSKFVLTIQTDTALTGNPFYDETLKEDDWLSSEMHPTLSFTSKTITALSATQFTIDGDLIVKGKSYPQTIVVNATNKGLSSTISLSRLALGIGVSADEDAEWVADTIKIDAFWQP